MAAAADFMTGSNNEDGFVKAIERFVLGETVQHGKEVAS
jgi:hypothetical protein